ncbi:hypothetical protein SAMN05421858_5123 [Haladaptatus litoreus]|uniref:Uncharacterized protein n=1 Tax=Haladaptatus litoreus TaxID=553468 RepID=A0A1N7FK13_9EURY|nr:hypothetical protein [Haladaptatus litoreus]SIS00575.1 hypothetical protein SAMN05421858_5123 [Haladaptatus litoreus]
MQNTTAGEGTTLDPEYREKLLDVHERLSGLERSYRGVSIARSEWVRFIDSEPTDEEMKAALTERLTELTAAFVSDGEMTDRELVSHVLAPFSDEGDEQDGASLDAALDRREGAETDENHANATTELEPFEKYGGAPMFY